MNIDILELLEKEQSAFKAGIEYQKNKQDEFAIEFAEWLRYNNVETDYGWQNGGKHYSDTEIVKLFKEEKGL